MFYKVLNYPIFDAFYYNNLSWFINTIIASFLVLLNFIIVSLGWYTFCLFAKASFYD